MSEPNPENQERDVRVVVLYNSGLSYGEIAARVGITESAAAGIIHRAGAARKLRRRQALALESPS